MNPERAEQPRQSQKFGPSLQKSQQQFPIHGEGEAFVETPPDPFPQGSPPEQSFLGHEIRPTQNVGLMRRQNPPPDLAVMDVDQQTVAVDHFHMGMTLKRLRDGMQGPRQQQVVGIKIGHDLAIRNMVETAIYRDGLAAIGSGLPIGQPRFVASEYIDRTVIRAAVHHGIVQGGIAGIQHALNRSLDELPLPE